jgi:cell division protein FtsN
MHAEDTGDRRTGNNERRRGIVFSLRPVQIVVGAVVLCLGYAAVFFLGVVLGRGYTPEAGIPELARLMPEASAPISPRIVAPEEEIPTQEDTTSPSVPPGGDEDTTFTQADLDYRERLKTRPQTAASSAQGAGRTGDGAAGRNARSNERKADGINGAQARRAAEAKMPRAAEAKTPKAAEAKAPKAAEAKAPKAAEAKAPKAAEAAAKTAERPPAPPERADAMYRYMYQVASYKDRAPGDDYAKRLRAAGFKASTEQSTGNDAVWFRTMVEFTGRPDDTDALREKLKRHGAPRALLRSKTPVN